MKLILSGIAAMAGLVWYLGGGGGGPDASREVAKPPAFVYSEMASLFPAGTTHLNGTGRDGLQRDILVEVEKSPDRWIKYRMMLDGAEVMTMDLHFEHLGAVMTTRVTGNLDVEQSLVRFAASQDGSEARHLPDFAVNIAMDQMVSEMADAIEQGRPLSKNMLFPLMRLSS